MKSPNSSSASSNRAQSLMANTNSDHHRSYAAVTQEDGYDFDGDPAAWAAFTNVFGEVQSVLDRNRTLIHQVNQNQQSKIRGNMVKNVAMIQEINGNMTKVISLYSNLSDDISGRFSRRTGDAKNNR